MGNLTNISGVMVLGLLSAACATMPSSRQSAAVALQTAPAPAASQAAASAGLASAVDGDNWTAANLFERALNGDNSPANRFNLAASYQRTGRIQQASRLYRSVMVDGQFTSLIILPDTADRGGRMFRVNIADESQRRLVVMAFDAARGTPKASTASDGGVNASAIVGGPTRGTVSDASALRLDDKAEAIAPK
ncbi:hypothetical protein [Phenylobacterium sp.]|uniref:hypothetical protein n=1 Tax=Phenylobacterium sp. TaxID=1871053 RepID=UPI002DEC782E|nr:hypothetical protein [Phenylobacterium sp.]